MPAPTVKLGLIPVPRPSELRLKRNGNWRSSSDAPQTKSLALWRRSPHWLSTTTKHVVGFVKTKPSVSTLRDGITRRMMSRQILVQLRLFHDPMIRTAPAGCERQILMLTMSLIVITRGGLTRSHTLSLIMITRRILKRCLRHWVLTFEWWIASGLCSSWNSKPAWGNVSVFRKRCRLVAQLSVFSIFQIVSAWVLWENNIIVSHVVGVGFDHFNSDVLTC